MTGAGLSDGQIALVHDNADDSILELLAQPDPTLTNFIVGANSKAHHIVAAIFDFLRTYDKDGGEIARALAQMTDDERGDTTLNFLNMIDGQIYTNEQLLCMPFGGYENSDDCQWRWEQVGLPWSETRPEWMTATQLPPGVPGPLFDALVEKLKRWTVQMVAKSQPDKFGYDCRESWNVTAISGPYMCPRSGRHYANTWPHVREESLYRLMSWMKRFMCKNIPPMCNACHSSLEKIRYRW